MPLNESGISINPTGIRAKWMVSPGCPSVTDSVKSFNFLIVLVTVPPSFSAAHNNNNNNSNHNNNNK